MPRPAVFSAIVFFYSLIVSGACLSNGKIDENSNQGKDAQGGQSVRDANDDFDAKKADASDLVSNEVHRFIVIGDTGTGDKKQQAVADAIEQKCEADGCEFVILLGDNFYEDGIQSIDDPLWQSHFEEPYRNIDLPFYVVMGNHDYGYSGRDLYKADVQIEYSTTSDKWNMPSPYYTLKIGSLGFMMINTYEIIRRRDTYAEHSAWYTEKRPELDGSDWVFIAGHHPFLSNGVHGNAGTYDGTGPNDSAGKSGRRLKEFFEQTVCGTVDLSFSGHDHNRQWIEEPGALCGAPLIISGAGGRLTPFDGPGENTALFADASKVGFAYIVTEGNQMTLQFLDSDGNLDFEKSITK